MSQKLQIIQGSSLTVRLTVTEEDTADRVDLTGAAVHFRVKKLITDTALVISKSTAVPAEIVIASPQTGDTEGQADVFFQPSDTSGIDLTIDGKHVFDAWVVLASGKRHSVVNVSVFDVQRAVTVL